MDQKAIRAAQQRAHEYLRKAGIVLTAKEADNIEIAHLGLGELEQTGLELITYVNTERVCAKELVLFPRQTCPEHKHPPIDGTTTCAPGCLLHGLARDRVASRRTVHDRAEHLALVPGRR